MRVFLFECSLQARALPVFSVLVSMSQNHFYFNHGMPFSCFKCHLHLGAQRSHLFTYHYNAFLSL